MESQISALHCDLPLPMRQIFFIVFYANNRIETKCISNLFMLQTQRRVGTTIIYMGRQRKEFIMMVVPMQGSNGLYMNEMRKN